VFWAYLLFHRSYVVCMLYVFLSFRTGSFNYLRSDVFATVKMRIVFFWSITPYILARYSQRFGVRYRLHLQGRKFVTTCKAPQPWRSQVLDGNPIFLDIIVVYTANEPGKSWGERVVSVSKQVFVNQYSCLAESKSWVIKSSVEKVYFQVVKFVWIYPCTFNHPCTMPKWKSSKSCHLRQTVSEFGEHIFPQMTQ
jgi:hypothetical protein